MAKIDIDKLIPALVMWQRIKVGASCSTHLLVDMLSVTES